MVASPSEVIDTVERPMAPFLRDPLADTLSSAGLGASQLRLRAAVAGAALVIMGWASRWRVDGGRVRLALWVPGPACHADTLGRSWS